MERVLELLETHGRDFKSKLLDPVFFSNDIIGWDKLEMDSGTSGHTSYQEEWLRLLNDELRLLIMAFRSCLHMDTIIYTRDGKACRIKDCKDSWSTGIRKIYKITLKNGHYVKCTDNHPICTVIPFVNNYQFKRLSELKVGDNVVCLKDFSKFGNNVIKGFVKRYVNMYRTDNIFINYKVDNDLSKLIGYLVADGYLSTSIKNGQSIKFTNINDKYLDEVDSLTRKIFNGVKVNKYKKGNGYDLVFTYGNKTGAKSGEMRNFFKCMIFDDKFPLDVFNFSKDNLCNFLNRLYSSDGCCYVGKKHCEITMACGCSEIFAKYHQLLLKKLGIVSFIKYKKSGKYNTQYLVTIQKLCYIKKFLDEVGFIFGKEDKCKQAYNYCINNSHKYCNYSDNKNFRIKNNDGELLYASEIKSIDYIGEDEVYDINIPNKHWFVAEGLVVHNSGKTETAFVRYPIFKAFTKANWQGIVVSKSLPQSTEIIKRIKQRIIENDILRTSIPDTRSATWSRTELELKNGSRIMSKPANVNLAGYHVDWIGGDEIGYWEDMDVLTKTLPPIVRARNGQIVFSGTPTSETDPIHQLMKNPAYKVKVYPANLKVDDKFLWDIRYPKIPIKQARKEYDSISWSREFLCRPLSAEDRIFPYDLIKDSFDFGSSFVLKRNNRYSYFMGLDFALSGEAGSDFSVFIVLEKCGDVCRIANIERFKGLSYQSQKGRIRQLYNTYMPIKVVADEGSFGKSFLQDMRAEHVPVEGFRFTNESKQNLITNLRNFFEQKRIIMPNQSKDLKTTTNINLLLKELDKFGVVVEKGTVKLKGVGEHDDMVMSLGLACWAARGLSGLTWGIKRGSSGRPSGVSYLGRVN